MTQAQTPGKISIPSLPGHHGQSLTSRVSIPATFPTYHHQAVHPRGIPQDCSAPSDSSSRSPQSIPYFPGLDPGSLPHLPPPSSPLPASQPAFSVNPRDHSTQETAPFTPSTQETVQPKRPHPLAPGPISLESVILRMITCAYELRLKQQVH